MTILLTAALIFLLVGADQAIKLWAIENLKGQPSRSFLPLGNLDWMHLTYLENDGAAFSMMSGFRGFLIVFPVIMIFVCLYLLLRLGRTHRWLFASLPLIAAGGIGNLIDRMFRGGRVVDFFDFQLFHFAVFNFADICVSIGVIVMVIGILFIEKEEPTAKTLRSAERVPFARQAAELPEAEPLAEAGILPDADTLPEAGPAEPAEALPENDEAAEIPALPAAENDHA